MSWNTGGGEHFIASNPASALAAATTLPAAGTVLSGGPLSGVKLQDKGGFAYNLQAYSTIAADLVEIADAGITSGQAILSSASAAASWVGKKACIAGAGGANLGLVGTILSAVPGVSVTIDTNASATVSGAQAFIGTDDSSAAQAIVNALPSGAALQIAALAMLLLTTLNVPANLTVVGTGYGSRICMGAATPVRTITINTKGVATLLRLSGLGTGNAAAAGRGAIHISGDTAIAAFNFIDASATCAITIEGFRSQASLNVILNPKEHGIYLSGGVNAQGEQIALANIIYQAGLNASGITGGSGIQVSSGGSRVEVNVVRGSGNHSLLVSNLSTVGRVRISGNFLAAPGASSYNCYVTTSVGSNPILIDGNTLVEDVSGADSLLVLGGVAHIRGNEIRRLNGSGSAIRLSGSVLDACIIEMNTLIADTAGLTMIDLNAGNAHVLRNNAILIGAATPSVGIIVRAGRTNVILVHNFPNQASTPITDNGTTTKIIDPTTPPGVSAITVTASPFTYTAGARPEAVYITAGTVSLVVKNSITLFTASPCTVFLDPNEAVVVTYSVAPTMNKDPK